jgi:hypothetical protein
MFPQDHPIWRIANLAVVLLGTALVMWVNASDFDETELRALIEIMMVMGGYEAFKQFKAVPSSRGGTTPE